MTIDVLPGDVPAFKKNIESVFEHDGIEVKVPATPKRSEGIVYHQITVNYQNKSIGLTELQQATELKIQHIEHALIQANTADEKEQANWNVKALNEKLESARQLQRELHKIAHPKMLKKMHFRSLSFLCIPAKVAEFNDAIKNVFGESIRIENKSDKSAVFIKAGKEISYTQLMDDVTDQRVILNEHLGQLQDRLGTGGDNAEAQKLIEEKKAKIAAADILAQKLRDHSPLIGRIGIWKKNKIKTADFTDLAQFNDFRNALSKASSVVNITIMRTTDSVQIFQGKQQISLEEFKYFSQKQRDKIQLQIDRIDPGNEAGAQRIVELREQHDKITTALAAIDQVKDTTSAVAKAVIWCFKEFKSLFTLDKKISFNAKGLAQGSKDVTDTLQKLSNIFDRSIEFKGKSFFRKSVTITEHGKALSKEELTARVEKKIDQLQYKILYSSSAGKAEKETAKKNLEDLQAISRLLKERMSEHRAMKVIILAPVLLSPLILVALPGYLLKKAARAASTSWKARKLDGRISYLRGINFHSIADPGLRKQALGLKETLNRNSRTGFPQAYKKLIENASLHGKENDLKIIQNTIKSQGNFLLKLALRNGQPEAAKFLIRQGFFKNVSLIQGKKFSVIVKNRLSLNTSVLEELENSPHMPPAQRADIYRSLYMHCDDGASMGRIVNHLFANGHKVLAEDIVLTHLELPKSLREQSENESASLDAAGLSPEDLKSAKEELEKSLTEKIQNLQTKLNASRLLAAKIGSPKLLKAAFGIEPGHSSDDIKNNQMVKDCLFLSNTKCKTLLHFACEGSHANFVLGVDLAMRDFNNNSAALKTSLESVIKKIPLVGKLTVIATDEMAICVALPYLKDKFDSWRAGDLSNREFKNLLTTQLANLLESPFDVKDTDGSKPIHKMNMSLAIELDKAAETQHCFTSAVAYYDYVNAPPNKLVIGSVMAVEFASCIGIAFLEPLGGQYNFLEKNLLFQPLTLVEIGLGTAFGVLVTKPYHRLMARHWQGLTQQHAAYELKHQLTSWEAKKTENLEKAKAHVIKNRNWDLIARFSTTFDANSDLMKNGLTELRSHSVAKALITFQGITETVNSKPFKSGDSYSSAVIDAYSEILYGKERDSSAQELFDVLFGRFESVEDLKQMFDTHIKRGPNGIAFALERLEDKIKNPSTLSLAQYEACLLLAVELGRNDLKRALWNLQNHRIAFESSGGWNQFGALLLTLTAASKYGADKEYANIAKSIFMDWDKANQIAKRTGERNISDPYTVNLMDMSLQRAHAFDAVMGRNPYTNNSYAHMIQKRDKKNDLELALDFSAVGAVKFGLDPVGLLIALVAESARVAGGLVGGPAAPVVAALAGGVATFTLETIAVTVGFIASLQSSSSVAEAWSRSRTFWNRVDEQINKLPGDHEAHMRMKEAFGTAAKWQIMGALGQLPQDPNISALQHDIAVITEDGFGPTILEEISRAIIQADLTPEQRNQIAVNLNDPEQIAKLTLAALNLAAAGGAASASASAIP